MGLQIVVGAARSRRDMYDADDADDADGADDVWCAQLNAQLLLSTACCHHRALRSLPTGAHCCSHNLPAMCAGAQS